MTSGTVTMKGSFAQAVCEVPGCGRPARYNPWAWRRKNSRWCERCRRLVRKWGDPRQPVLLIKTVRPLIHEVQDVIKRDATGKLEAVATQLCLNLRDHVEEVVTDLDRGRPIPNWTARAARVLLEILTEKSPVECASAAAALFLLREREPRRFVSDDGWRHTFVRTWRKALSKTAFGSYWDHRRQRALPMYRELPLHVVQNMAALLLTTFAPLGSRIVLLDQRRGKRGQQAIKQALDEAFDAIDNHNHHDEEPTGRSR